MRELPPPRTTPVHLHMIGGLHGAGKTSFIQYQIDHVWAGEKLGIILCEEGRVKLDFSRSVAPTVKRLLHACVCCEMAYAFFEVIVELLHDPEITRIVVEIPAQADVQQIFDFIRGSHLKNHLHFEPTHVLVDLRNPHMRPDSPMPLIRRLLDQAEVLVLNFHDQAAARRFEAGEKKWMLSPLMETERSLH